MGGTGKGCQDCPPSPPGRGMLLPDSASYPDRPEKKGGPDGGGSGTRPPGAGSAAELRSRLRPWPPPVRSSVRRRQDCPAAAAEGLPQGRTEPACAEAGPPQQKWDEAGADTATRTRPSVERRTGSGGSAPPPVSGHVTSLHAGNRSGRAGRSRGSGLGEGGWAGLAVGECLEQVGAGPRRSETDSGAGAFGAAC